MIRYNNSYSNISLNYVISNDSLIVKDFVNGVSSDSYQNWLIVTGALGCLTLVMLLIYLTLIYGQRANEVLCSLRDTQMEKQEKIKRQKIMDQPDFEEEEVQRQPSRPRFYTHTFLTNWFKHRTILNTD